MRSDSGYSRDSGDGDGGGPENSEARTKIAPTVAVLIGLQRRRKFLIRIQNKIGNSTGAYLRSCLGWSPALPEAERETIRKQAAKIIKTGEFDGLDDGIAATIALAQESRLPFDDERKRIDKEMKRQAGTLPVAGWTADVKGFGELGLAVTVAEAGDLSNYPTVSTLRKRLGWAPKPCYYSEEYDAHLVPRQRKAQIWSCVTDPLFRKQWAAEKNDVPAHPIGPYGEAYQSRRLCTAETHPDWTKAHSHADGLRVMTQCLLRDLWAAWREASSGMNTKSTLPPAPPHQEAAE